MMKPIQPLGPEGVQRRMQEIQSRMQALQRQPHAEFSQHLSAAQSQNPNVNFHAPIGEHLAGFAPLDPTQGNFTASRPQSGNFSSLISQHAEANGLPPVLLEALVSVESSFNPSAVSSAGAQGLTQLMPATARSLGVTDPFDPNQNLSGGARYLAAMMREFKELPLALAAYNAGPGNVRRYGGIPPFTETQNYVRKVMNLAGLDASNLAAWQGRQG